MLFIVMLRIGVSNVTNDCMLPNMKDGNTMNDAFGIPNTNGGNVTFTSQK